MKKIKPATLNLQTTEEDHYIITQKEAEMLSDGTLIFRNGHLYRTDQLFPQEVDILNIETDLRLINIYRTKNDFQDLLQSPFNRPTLNMIDAKTHENLGPLNPTAEDLTPCPIDMDNLVAQDPTYLSVGVEGLDKVLADTKELEQALDELYYSIDHRLPFFHFIERAKMLYEDYKMYTNTIDNDEPDPEFTKWSIAIHLQELYWESFRGRTITILKLFNKFLNPDNELYHLETPITGMKKKR